MVKVIWHKATSPLHMDGSVLFTRWRQLAPHLMHPQSASAPYWFCPLLVTLSILTPKHVQSWPGLTLIPLYMGIWTLSSTLFLGPMRINFPNGITIGLATSARLADRLCYSIWSNRPQLASAKLRHDDVNGNIIGQICCGILIWFWCSSVSRLKTKTWTSSHPTLCL